MGKKGHTIGRIAGVSVEETRSRLLQAAARLLWQDRWGTERAVSLDALSVRDVCSEAGLSTGAFYGHWEGIEQFRTDLGLHVLATTDSFDADHQAMLQAARSFGGSVEEALIQVAAAELAAMRRSRTRWLVETELVLRLHRAESYREAAAEGYRTLDEIDGAIYVDVLKSFGREFVSPWTATSAYRVIQALVEGVMLRSLVDLGAGFDPTDGDAGFYPRAVASFLLSISRVARTSS